MHIDEILANVAAGDTQPIPESWAQGRTIFGGLTGAILCQATQRAVPADRRLRSLSIGFVRPFETQMPYQIETEHLGNGRTLTIESARIVQEGKVRAVARAEYMLPISSDVHIERFTVPPMKSIEDSIGFPREQLPKFFSHFEGHVATPYMPFSGQAGPELGGWIRFLEAPEKITEAHLVCLIDAWPPTASPHYQGFKPLSTISWNMHFAAPADTQAPDVAMGYHAEVNFGEDCASSSSASIWRPDGQLLAKSMQTNIIYG